MEDLSFSGLPISEEILRALTDMGFEEATPIQAETIPHILEGRDLLGQAQTGTGKTCAFGIPVIDSIDPASTHIQTLILSPTRELAIQIAEELHNIAKYKEGVRIVAIYGGQPIDRQIMALKRKPQIIVGTPGRVMDHMRRKTLRLANLEKIVLDEADEMLNMGFKEDIDTILESTPEIMQKIFFSATMPRAIVELTNKYLKDPIHVKISSKEMTIPQVKQFYIEVREANKVEIMTRLIDAGNVTRALVFCNTKRKVDELTDKLNTRGYSVEALHGDMKQASRDRVMKQFRTGKLDLLVATDVAARGIDVDDIEVVFNYDLPTDDEYYVHRVGRTARAGKSGSAYTFVVGREIIDLKNIQHSIKATISRANIPTLMNVKESRISGVLQEIGDVLAQGDLADYVKYIDQYAEGLNLEGDEDHFYTTTDIAAALLKKLCGEQIEKRDEIQEVVPYEEFSRRPPRSREQSGDIPSLNTRNHGKTVESGMQRLFLNVGIKDHMRPNQIVQFIASNGEIPGKAIGAIAIFNEYTFVDIPTEMAEQVVSKTNARRIGRTMVHVELKRDSLEGAASVEERPSSTGEVERSRPEARAFTDKKSYDRKESGTVESSAPRTYKDKKSYAPKAPRAREGYESRGPRDREGYESKGTGEKKSYAPKAIGEKKSYAPKAPGEKRSFDSKGPTGDKKRTYGDKKKPDFESKPRERKPRTEI